MQTNKLRGRFFTSSKKVFQINLNLPVTILALALLPILVIPTTGQTPGSLDPLLQVSADLILLNGKFFTADLAKPSAEAIAVRGEHIIAVGTNKEIENVADGKTRRIDLQNRVVVPGFNDSHFHFMPDPKGFTLQFKTLEPSWKETVEAIEAAVKQTSAGTWVFGYIGHDVVLNPEVTRFVLDRIAPNHPVLLRAYYGHGYIVNSTAMPLLQISADEPDPIGGYYERVAGSNKINGRFGEYAQWKPNRILVNQVSDAEAIKELKKMAAEAVGFGITSMQIMSSMSVDRFAKLVVKADLPIRVRVIPFAMTTPKKRDLSEIEMLSKLKFLNSKVKVSGIKWILDGTPLERGAALRQPYSDKLDWKGKLNFPESEVLKLIKESLVLKQQFLAHCAGDKCTETVFDAMEKTDAKIDWKSLRYRIEHGDGVTDDLIARARKLGVIVVQNPTHFSDSELFQRRWGMKMQPLRSLIEAGVTVAFGSDGPMNPFLNIMMASIHPAHPNEAITREQAVTAYTSGSAFAEFAENEKGALTIGKLADLTVLSQDIFALPMHELPKTRSILTIVGGKIVYDQR